MLSGIELGALARATFGVQIAIDRGRATLELAQAFLKIALDAPRRGTLGGDSLLGFGELAANAVELLGDRVGLPFASRRRPPTRSTSARVEASTSRSRSSVSARSCCSAYERCLAWRSSRSPASVAGGAHGSTCPAPRPARSVAGAPLRPRAGAPGGSSRAPAGSASSPRLPRRDVSARPCPIPRRGARGVRPAGRPRLCGPARRSPCPPTSHRDPAHDRASRCPPRPR